MDAGLLARAAGIVAAADRIAVLTGAGVSAESGVPTFRGPNGLWKTYRPEQLATPEAFEQDPLLVWEFYNYRRNLLASVEPNAAHRALAQLESACAHFTLVTQNVDGLHQRAGSRRVFEVHGNIWVVRCTGCGIEENRQGERLSDSPRCAKCNAWLRPGVVWFGESLPMETWSAAEQAVSECNCLLVIGTGAQVHPAAGLAWLARDAGAQVIEINLERTPASDIAHVGLYGPAGQIMPGLVDQARSIRSSRERIA